VNAELSIPPLRDLPPGRLALRAQHLHSALVEQQGRPRLRPRTVALVVLALAALVLVPIGGASLGSRALEGIGGVWRSGQLPPAPRPYQPGDKVWTTEPPQHRVAITIDCPNGIADAANRLAELDREGSPINEVNCR
jgi:hypothetical protein